MAAAPGQSRDGAPKRAGLVLGSLIAVAAVANLGLAVANVALPSIGQHFDASQTALNLVAVGYSLGLAASVLYFGAVGDRYGRKLLLVLGMVLTVPADCLAAWAPSIDVLLSMRTRKLDEYSTMTRTTRKVGGLPTSTPCATWPPARAPPSTPTDSPPATWPG